MNMTEVVADFNYFFLTGIDQKDQPFYSLDPNESDLVINSKILNALIGTLVKYGNSGKIEPYLAERLDVSTDKLHWNFTLRKGLVCEDGTVITASSFKDILEKRLLSYAEKGSVLVFDNIAGWDQFLKGGKLEGIQARDELNLTFSLVKEEKEFLEYLRMPYFGYWCPGNFENGKFKNEFSVVSSGAYKVSKISNGNELVLLPRKGWFSIDSESPKKIIFSPITRESISEAQSHSMIELGLNTPEEGDEVDFHVVYGVPTILLNIVLNPYNGFFANIDNRRIFASAIFNDGFKAVSKNRIRTNFFFIHDQNKMAHEKSVSPTQYTNSSETLIFAVSARLSDGDLNPLKDAIQKALPNSKVEFVKPDKSVKDWHERLLSNKYYSGRITSVDAGGSFSNSPIKMIFCSNLGACYPDPSGRICALAREYEIAERDVDEKYITTFNQALVEDAAVIPIYFSSASWLVGKGIDLDSIPSSVMYFQYEKLRFR